MRVVWLALMCSGAAIVCALLASQLEGSGSAIFWVLSGGFLGYALGAAIEGKD